MSAASVDSAKVFLFFKNIKSVRCFVKAVLLAKSLINQFFLLLILSSSSYMKARSIFDSGAKFKPYIDF